jgi:hypothetical protein
VSSGTPGTTTSGGSSAKKACLKACDANNAAGAQTFSQLDDQWTTCACAANACGSQCGTSSECSSDDNAPDPSDACNSCLDSLPCDQQEESACQKDPGCAAFMACVDDCEKAAGN